jgi:hypothetical protein
LQNSLRVACSAGYLLVGYLFCRLHPERAARTH